MYRALLCATIAGVMLVPAAPARGQARDADVDRDRAAAERTLERSRPFRWIGGLGAGLSVAASFMSYEQRTGPGGKALAVGGVTALGMGLIGDLARYRARTRLDALDSGATGGLDSPARADAERTLRLSRRLGVLGDVGAAMLLAMPFFPDHLCETGETCPPAAKAYILGGVAALGVGIAGWIKTGRAESRLEAFDETSHRVGVAPLRDGAALSYSVAW